MEELTRNRNNQTRVRIIGSDGEALELDLGAGATRAIHTFAVSDRDVVLGAASRYAASQPLGSDRFVWDNHIAAVTGGANDVRRWRQERRLREPAVPGPLQMPDGSDVLSGVGFPNAASQPSSPSLTLREFLTEIASSYDRTAGTGHPTQRLIRAAPRHLTDYAPVGFIVHGRAGAGMPAAIPWIGFLDPDETTSPLEGLYVVYLFSADLDVVWLTLIQGITRLHERVRPPARARERLTADGARIRERLGSAALAGFVESVDLRARGRLPLGYAAGAVAALRYDTTALPSEQELGRDLAGMFRLYQDAIAAKRDLLLTAPGAISTPSGSPTPPARSPLEHFKPKDATDYKATLTGGTIVKTRRHEALIHDYGDWAVERGFAASTAEHPKDLVLRREGREWLVEGKVLYRGNAAGATRAAIGQLVEYRRFLYSDDAPAPTLVALFTETIGNAYVGLLEELGILAIWRDQGKWTGNAAAVIDRLTE
jgi:hypothetical protein